MTNESIWDKFTRTGQEMADEFPERAEVPDGMYRAKVVRVGDPYDKPNAQTGEMETKFVVEFELSGSRLRGETALIPAFPRLTAKFLDTGYLSEKAQLFKIMSALGFDMSRFKFAPPEWIGLECDVVVKDNWIDSYLRVPDDEQDEPPARPSRAAPTREPVGASAGRSRSRKEEEDWGD